MIKEPQDAVNPSHYNGKLCLNTMTKVLGKEVTEGFCLGNVFKYLWRHDEKNGQEDVEKAVWYFDEFKNLVCEEDKK